MIRCTLEEMFPISLNVIEEGSDDSGPALRGLCETLNALSLNDWMFLVQEPNDPDAVWNGTYVIYDGEIFYAGTSGASGEDTVGVGINRQSEFQFNVGFTGRRDGSKD